MELIFHWYGMLSSAVGLEWHNLFTDELGIMKEIPQRSVFIKKLAASDWDILKQIRCRALKLDPQFFSSTLQKELQYTKEEWQLWLDDHDCAIYALCKRDRFSQEQVIGMTAISIDRHDATRTRAVMWGSWLEPQYRGRGLSQLMYETRLEWARDHPEIKEVQVSHRHDNIASQKANQKHGFVHTHTQEREWPDGKVDKEHVYKLLLREKLGGISHDDQSA